MAGVKENSDWSILFVEPPVINIVTDLLERYDACRDRQGPGEFLKVLFEGDHEDPQKSKTWSHILSKKHSKSQRSLLHLTDRKATLNPERSIVHVRSPTKQTQQLKSETAHWKCTYPELCEMYAENLQIGLGNEPNYQEAIKESSDIESSDYPENKCFRCTCISQDELSTSSSEIHSDSDDSEFNIVPCDERESLDKREFSGTDENLNEETNTAFIPTQKLRSSLPVNGFTKTDANNEKMSFVPQSGEIMKNNTEIGTRTSQIPKLSEAKPTNRLSSDIRIPNLDLKVVIEKHKKESVQGKDHEGTSKLENRSIYSVTRNIKKSSVVNQPGNSANNENRTSHTLQAIPKSEKNNEDKLRKNIETEDKEEEEKVEIDSKMQLPEDSECQIENRPISCGLFSVGKEYIALQPTAQKEPEYFYLRLDDDRKQAAIKMFLHILDYEEFITISLTSFTKSTRPYIKINIPFFKVAAYLLFFNLSSLTFNGTKNNLIEICPTKSLQFLNFIVSEEYQKNYDKLLRLYDHDFVKNYAYDHARGHLVKKMQEEIQRSLEKPTTIEIRRAEINQKPSKRGKRGETHVSPSRKDASEPEPPRVVTQALPVPKTTYAAPRNKFYKSLQDYEEEKLQRKKKKEESPIRKPRSTSEQRPYSHSMHHHPEANPEFPVCEKSSTCKVCVEKESRVMEPKTDIRESRPSFFHHERTRHSVILDKPPHHDWHLHGKVKVCDRSLSCEALSKVCDDRKQKKKVTKKDIRQSRPSYMHHSRTSHSLVFGAAPHFFHHFGKPKKVCERSLSCGALSKICDEDKRPKRGKSYIRESRPTTDIRRHSHSLHHLHDVVDKIEQLPGICEKTLKPMICDACHRAKASKGIPPPYSSTESTFERKGRAHIRRSGIQFREESRSMKSALEKTMKSTLEEAIFAATEFRKPAVKSPPDFSKVTITVKPTAASVLREGACLRSKEMRTLQNLEWIASGGADYAAVEDALAKRREDQQQEEMEAIERKHLQGLLTREEAIIARQQLLVRQREIALDVKRQKEDLEKLLVIFQKEEEEKIKALVEKTHSIEAAAREKSIEVQKMKSDSVQKMVREAREKMVALQKQRRDELLQRINLIREVRALQGLSKMKHKEIDLTESAGLGLMGEMSIAELHERLNLLREELREQVERKRAKAQYFRTQMKQHVQDTQKYINKQRLNRVPEASKVNQMKNSKKIESEELKQLREKLNETRRLRMSNTLDI